MWLWALERSCLTADLQDVLTHPENVTHTLNIAWSMDTAEAYDIKTKKITRWWMMSWNVNWTQETDGIKAGIRNKAKLHCLSVLSAWGLLHNNINYYINSLQGQRQIYVYYFILHQGPHDGWQHRGQATNGIRRLTGSAFCTGTLYTCAWLVEALGWLPLGRDWDKPFWIFMSLQHNYRMNTLTKAWKIVLFIFRGGGRGKGEGGSEGDQQKAGFFAIHPLPPSRRYISCWNHADWMCFTY